MSECIVLWLLERLPFSRRDRVDCSRRGAAHHMRVSGMDRPVESFRRI